MQRIHARLLGVISCYICATFILFAAGGVQGQQAAAQKRSAENSSGKNAGPFVIELFSTKVRFETDGTGERQQEVRVRIANAAGADALRTLVFNYNSVNEKFALAYLRVTKADGSVSQATAEQIAKMTEDAPAPAAKSAPGFIEIREARITPPLLAAGDTLDYEADTKIVSPAAPGEFWYTHNFLTSTMARDEELQIDLPANRAVHWKNAQQFPPTITAEGTRKIYAWKRLNAQPAAESNSANAAVQDAGKPPDVLVTSFANWQELGEWEAAVASKAAKPGEAVTSKEQELTAEKKSDEDRMEALYNYAAKKVRLVSLPPEQVNFTPHDAAATLNYGYGDELDKCTLLVALLDAAGFRASMALVTPTTQPKTDLLPWPGAFSHTLVTVESGKDVFWMDPASDVMPFRMLPPKARGKQALVVSTTPAPHFAETPKNPPFLSTQTVEITGSVNSLGRLVARVRYTLRGDNEVALRMAFKKTPEVQWKEVAQTMATLDGLRGEVTEARPSDPTATRDPFVLDFILVDENFLDWSQASMQLALPLPTFGLPDPPENTAQHIEIGSPLDVTTKLHLTLPANDFVQIPAGSGFAQDFAEYRSNYSAEEHAITAERTLRFLAGEVPAAHRADYQTFARAVEEDESLRFSVRNIIPGVPEDATSNELMESGTAALKAGRDAKALLLFGQVAQLDPKRKDLWRDLGLAQMGTGKYDDAAASFRKQLGANPADETANNLLGAALYGEKRYDDAAGAFKKQIALKPLDPTAHAYLGAVYMDQKRFADALAELEKAVVLDPDNAPVRIRLGEAYLGVGKTDAAVGAFDRAASLSPGPLVWNQIAYDLAEHDAALESAEHYATLAVGTTEARLRDLELSRLTRQDVESVATLPPLWDTLGWVRFQQGKIKEAEDLVRAAWLLDQIGDAGYHLARIYEQGGERESAIRTYTLALAMGSTTNDARARLAKLLGGESISDSRVKRASTELTAMRTVRLEGAARPRGKAVFLVLLEAGASGPRVASTRFLSGNDQLSALADRLRRAKFPDVLPAGTQARIFLRGTLDCTGKTAQCNFVYDPPRDLLAPH